MHNTALHNNRGGLPLGNTRGRATPLQQPLSLFGTRRTAAAATGQGGFAGASAGQKDVTAELLQAAVSFGVKTRLKAQKSVDVDVFCTGQSLLEGRFNGMRVVGSSWVTPLMLTADRIRVEVGEMVLDYGALVLQQRVALRNVPTGSVTITLLRDDMANFTVHPLMKQAAAAAVQGKEFRFDRDSVVIRTYDEGGGVVELAGIWAGDLQRYHVAITTTATAAATNSAASGTSFDGLDGSSNGGAGGGVAAAAAAAASGATVRSAGLQVTARRVDSTIAPPVQSATAGASAATPSDDTAAAATAARAAVAQAAARAAAMAATSTSAAGTAPQQQSQRGGPPSSSSSSASSFSSLPASVAEAAVAHGIHTLFTQLAIDLQGIHISKPAMRVFRQPTTAAAAPGSSAASSQAPYRELLDITMTIQLRSFPPLDMKF